MNKERFSFTLSVIVALIITLAPITSTATGPSPLLTTVPAGDDPQGIAYNPSNGLTYISNFESGDVSIYRGTEPVKNVHCCTAPVGVAYHPATSEIFVADYFGDRIAVIDADHNVSYILGFAPGSAPRSIAYNAHNGMMYVTNYFTASVSVISPDYEIVDTIDLGPSLPWEITYNSATGYMYVTDAINNRIFAIDSAADGSTDSRVESIPGVGTDPRGISYSPATGNVYTANYASATVTVINGVTHEIIDTVPVGSYPIALAYNEKDEIMYVVNSTDFTVSGINADNEVVHTFSVGAMTWPIAYTDHGVMYVGHRLEDSVSIFNRR